jgi:hypothetical protein
MKLNINAKELLALHNLLYERFDSSMGGTTYKEGDARANDDAQLQQVYNRVKACIVGALTNKAVDPLDAFFQREQAKIDDLTTQNESLKEVAKEVFNPQQILTADDDDGPELPQYPRKVQGPQAQKPGKHRGRR